MPNRKGDVFYSEHISIRVPRGHSSRPSHLVIRHTDVYRLRNVTSATITNLDPDLDHVLLFASQKGPIHVDVAGELEFATKHELLIVRDSRIDISAPFPTDIFLAVSQSSVIEGLRMHMIESSATMQRVIVNALLAAPLHAALDQAFDLVDAGGPGLDSRVLDFLHVLGRGILQLPFDVKAEEADEVPLLARARQLIRETHTDPATTPNTLSELLAVPLRTLQRAFGAARSSVSGELRVARARTAQALLSSASTRKVRPARAARDAGFGSVASMRRALRQLDAAAGTSSADGIHASSEDDAPVSGIR